MTGGDTPEKGIYEVDQRIGITYFTNGDIPFRVPVIGNLVSG